MFKDIYLKFNYYSKSASAHIVIANNHTGAVDATLKPM